MDESVKDQSSGPGNTEKSSKLRYPLRSANKSKEEKPLVAELPIPSVPKRGRLASTVSKSVSVLDISGKDKSGKPPRRLSIPTKSTVSPVPRSVGTITPISEARAKRSDYRQTKSDTPVSDVSKSSNQRKFNVLSSASYWLSQIKLSESAAKHTISLGFFKLALEAGCEPLQRMKDELNSYARRHCLAELGENVKELFEVYNILDNFEQLQVSETCSQVHGEGTQSSDDDIHSSSSITGTKKLKPKSLITNATAQASPITESAKKDAVKKVNPSTRTRGSLIKNSANAKPASEIAGRNLSKKSQKPSKQGVDQGKDEVKKPGKKTAGELGPANPSPTEEPLQENKENMMSMLLPQPPPSPWMDDAPQMEKISLSEV